MSSLTIRNLDDEVKKRLRAKAASNGHSMEEEARLAIRAYVSSQPSGNVYDTIRKRFEPVIGTELKIPPRGRGRTLVDLFRE